VAFSPDGSRLVSAGGDGTVRVWDATTDPEALTIGGVRGTVALNPDGSQLASVTPGGSGKVQTFDVMTGQVVQTFAASADTGTERGPLACSPDGTLIASVATGGTVTLWDVATGQVIDTLELPRTEAARVAFDAAGRRLAAAGRDRSLTVWDLTSRPRRVLFREPGDGLVGTPGGNPFGIAFSPDGHWLATGGVTGSVSVRSASTGKVAFTLTGHTMGVARLAFHPDPENPELATGSDGDDGTVKIWNLRTRRERLTLRGHQTVIRGLTFSSDGRRMISTSADNSAKVWDVASGQEILTLRGHLSSVWDVAITRDHSRLVTASLDTTVKIWDGRPWTEDSRAEREATGQLAFLFARPLSRADVVEHLRDSAMIRPRARQLALDLVGRYHDETDPESYHRASRAAVLQRFLNPFQYRFALLQAAQASRLAPDRAAYRATLGAAQYRAGRFAEAVATLEEAQRRAELIPADRAFLALAQHRLGEPVRARASLDRLRAIVAQPGGPKDPETLGLWREAERAVSPSSEE
jgi:WD40 repeat protein